MISEYKKMLEQLRALSSEILPELSPTGRYSRGDTLRTLAFRLFAHAEIESFLEQCAESLRVHYATKNSSGTLSRPIAHRLIWASEASKKYPPRSLTQMPANLNREINSILNNHQNTIDGNNGVSEKDVLKLLVPLGFDLDFFDHGWLVSMSELAHARGDAAHSSAMNVGTDQPTPEGELSLLLLPLRGLAKIALEVDRLQSLA